MLQKDNFYFVILLLCFVVPPLDGLLLPLLFPLSIKITIHSKPTPPPPVKSYHFEAAPVYREVSIKGSTHISAPKYSYGSGAKYGTSYGDGHAKVYTGLPTIDGHISITSNPAPPPKSAHITITSGAAYKDGPHYKGAPYQQTHYKGTTYEAPQKHYEGSVDSTHYKGTPYEAQQTHYGGGDDSTHYKGTAYEDVPATHYTGTEDSTHYKGSTYEGSPPTHVKGSAYEDKPSYSGTAYKDRPRLYDPVAKPKNVYKEHSYIKSVGGYKLTDYIGDDQAPNYDEDDDPGYIAIPPGKSFAEMAAAHRAANAHKLGGSPKAYAAEEYSDLGSRKEYGSKYGKENEHEPTYIDDTLPAYKATIPKPRHRSRKVPEYNYAASSSRYDRVAPDAKPKRVYAGFGTSVYGDSYAKIVYVPKPLKVSIRRHGRK